MHLVAVAVIKQVCQVLIGPYCSLSQMNYTILRFLEALMLCQMYQIQITAPLNIIAMFQTSNLQIDNMPMHF